jgi:putative FmdB family regulatory protein
MPIYEYRCPKCGEFEQMQRITDPPLQRCPTCRKKLTKLISSTSFQLKGAGWYVTDYANKESGKKDADKSDKGEKTDKKETKSEKKESATKDGSTSKASAAA